MLLSLAVNCEFDALRGHRPSIHFREQNTGAEYRLPFGQGGFASFASLIPDDIWDQMFSAPNVLHHVKTIELEEFYVWSLAKFRKK